MVLKFKCELSKLSDPFERSNVIILLKILSGRPLELTIQWTFYPKILLQLYLHYIQLAKNEV